MRISNVGYLERKIVKGHWRNWWLIKSNGKGRGYFSINSKHITFPSRFVGKKVRFKVEIAEDLNLKFCKTCGCEMSYENVGDYDCPRFNWICPVCVNKMNNEVI